MKLAQHSVLCLAAMFHLAGSTALAGVNESLFAAIREGNTTRIQAALQRGADARARNLDGIPALMQAALYANAGCMTLLLDRGASPAVADSFGATALMWAIPDMQKVELLLQRGADVNAVSATGRTPLLIAAGWPGASGIVRLLLEKGADPKARDRHGDTTVLRAAFSHDAETMRLLLDRGVDVNAPDEDGDTALIEAAGFGDLKLADMLLARGAQINWRDGDGVSALIAGDSSFHDLSMYRKLKAAGADLRAEDHFGRDLLIAAAASDTATPASLGELVAAGFDPARATKNLHGRTESALDWARRRGDTAALHLLGAPGAPPQPIRETELVRLHPRSPRESLAKALPLLLASGPTFVKKSGCVSCHHQSLPLLAYSLGRAKGVSIDEAMARRTTLAVLSVVQPASNRFLESIRFSGGPLTAAYIVLGLAADRHAADRSTDALIHYLTGTQMPDGSWRARSDRPPIESGFFAATALSLHALRLYPLPGRQAEFDDRVRRAARWLTGSQPRTSEERTFRLLGLVWAGAGEDAIRAAAQPLLEAQQNDGGWRQLATLDTDAYATGQALYALRIAARLEPRSVAYQNGIRFLMNAQLSDGSWLIRSRSYPVQPKYFDTGFPHGANQWISAAGTSWACIAITGAL